MAAEFLTRQGYQIIDKNWTRRGAEIDLIARDGDCLVFVEVKYRLSDAYGDPLISMDRRKIARLAKSAARYLAENDLAQVDCRFDVVAIRKIGAATEIEHIPNAFFPPEGSMP